MNRELYIHTLSQFRDECKRKHMDTETETFDAAIWALQTQEQLEQERDAALKIAAERREK